MPLQERYVFRSLASPSLYFLSASSYFYSHYLEYLQRNIKDGKKEPVLTDQEFDLARLGSETDRSKNANPVGGAGGSSQEERHEKPNDAQNTPKEVPHFDDTVYDQARLDKDTLDEVKIEHSLPKENSEGDQMVHRQLAEHEGDEVTEEEDNDDDGRFENNKDSDYIWEENEDFIQQENNEFLDDNDDNDNVDDENEGAYEDETDQLSDAFAAGVLKERKQWDNNNNNSPQHHRNRNTRGSSHGNSANAGGHSARARVAARAKELPAHIPVFTVVAMTVAMAGAAGLGALPFFFVKNLSKHWSAIATAIACGVMFAASFDLIHEGQPYGAQLVVLGIFLGGLFIKFMQNWLDQMEEVSFGHLHGNKARRLVLMVGIMAAHAIGEGCGVGVSFCGDRGWAQGVLTTLAIGVHNVPEGLAKATVLVSQGASAYEALFWSIVTCLPQPLVAVPSFIFVETFTMLLPTALGFAAGCMIWMVFAELLPEALEGATSSEVASAATLSAAALEGIRMSFEALEGPAGAFVSPFDGGNWEKLIPAVAEVAPAVFAAAIAASVVSGSSLPTPVVVCFSAAVLAVCGFAPLATQIVSSEVPLLHTLSATVAGMAAILLLRRYVLQSLLLRGSSGGSGGGNTHQNGSTSTSISGGGFHHEGNNGYMNGTSYYGGGGGGGGGNVTQRARGDYLISQPDSPSKMRGGLLPTGHGSSHGGATGKAPRRLAAPALAAGVTVLASLALQGIALGWHFTRQIAGVDIGALTLVPAMAATLAVHGAAAGGAIRAVAGRSVGAGAVAGLLIGGVSGSTMVSSYLNAPAKPDAIITRLTYPIGWKETLTAASCGALCMAALLQVAVAMSIHPKHARFGLVLGVLCLGALGGLSMVACVAGNAQICALVTTFLM